MLLHLLRNILYFVSGFFPRNPRRVLLGAWLGSKFSDNPKYLALYLAERHPELDLVWVGNPDVQKQLPADSSIRFVRRGSARAVWDTLTAGSVFVTHGYADIGSFNLTRGARRCYLGHGLAIKHMGGKDHALNSKILTAIRRIFRQTYGYDFYIASSTAHREKLLRENPTNNIEPGQIIGCGQPRIDYLLKNSEPTAYRRHSGRFRKVHALPPESRIITYLPTFRDKGTPAFSFAALSGDSRDSLEKLLREEDALLLEKSHFAEANGPADMTRSDSRIISLHNAGPVDTQELLLATDMLITDYSGCYVDFLVLHRPVIHFAYDRNYYETSDRGLYFNLDEIAGGPIVYEFEKLLLSIRAGLQLQSTGFKPQDEGRRLVEFENGRASETITTMVVGLPATDGRLSH